MLDYIQSYWHEIRSQWVEGLKDQQHVTFGESSLQRLESVSAKMKNVCCEIASLQQFFLEFRAFLVSMRAERTHQAMNMLTRKPTTSIPEDLLPYRDCLTPYAFRMVHQQYAESLTLGTYGLTLSELACRLGNCLKPRSHKKTLLPKYV